MSNFPTNLPGPAGATLQASAYEPRILVMCCVCHAHLGDKPCAPAQDGLVSHGYCPSCVRQAFAAALRIVTCR